MFENHFGFLRRPFSAAPDVELFVAHPAAEAAIDATERCLRGGQGIAVLTGPVGTGKSMVCQTLIQRLREEFAIAHVPSPGTTTQLGLLQAIYFGLGHRVKKKHGGLTDWEMRQELIESAHELRVRHSGVLVVVDEAHLLQPDQLEELRVLASFIERGRPLLQPLLVGDPELEDTLAAPQLKSLNQRIRCHSYLDSLTRAESRTYIQSQLKASGTRNPDIFTDQALERITVAADGNPRCLNQLCDESLFLAAQDGETQVSADIVSRALDELQRLPLTWNCSLAASDVSSGAGTDSVAPAVEHEGSAVHSVEGGTEDSVVEFGTLDDEPFAAPDSAGVCEAGSTDAAVEITGTYDAVIEPEATPPTGSAEDETLFIDITPLVEEDEILADEPGADVASTADLVESGSEDLNETFRQGLPEPPVPYTSPVEVVDIVEAVDIVEEPVVDRCYSLAADCAASEPVDDYRALKPRFDAPAADTDLFPDLHRRPREAGYPAHELAAVASEARTQKVGDAWTADDQAKRAPRFDPEPDVLSAEEQLLSSCIETRKEIASMLDSLESHVSESLAEQYDVVMPHGEAPIALPMQDEEHEVQQDLINERLRKVVDVERRTR